MDKMVRERNGWKRAVSLLLALCIAATLTVFTPAYAADTSWKKSIPSKRQRQNRGVHAGEDPP